MVFGEKKKKFQNRAVKKWMTKVVLQLNNVVSLKKKLWKIKSKNQPVFCP